MNNITSDLLKRINLNKSRLNQDIYAYPGIYNQVSQWPGDFVGRGLLALACLYQALDEQSDKENILDQINKILSHLDEYLNQDGYFGELFNPLNINEQQLAGNSWYIRSLVEYYKITKEEKIYDLINRIVVNFLDKLENVYQSYPLNDREMGEVGGHLNGTFEKWRTSTDSGCAFILLDGMTSCYELIKDEQLRKVIDDVINKFNSIDIVANKFQTHASVTVCRSLIRMYKVTLEDKYLNYAIKLFDTYLNEGLTLDYANFNWFNKKDTWTEPCCIIDSFISSFELYKLTNEDKYLHLANLIVTNNLRTFQRDNGGAGCSTCVYEKNDTIKMSLYEAYFCCTMRLGEGLKYLKTLTTYDNEEGELNILYPQSRIYLSSFNKVEINVDYYYSNKLTIKAKNPQIINLYVPDNMTIISSNLKYDKKGHIITINLLDKPLTIEYEFEVNKVGDYYFYGDMLLTKKAQHFDKVYHLDNQDYSYILNSSDFSEQELKTIEQHLR